MSKLEKITVLTAAYNAEKTIAQTINSVLNVETFPEMSLCRGASVETSYHGVSDYGVSKSVCGERDFEV